MFEQACNEHMRQFDDPFEEELEEEEDDEEEAGGDSKGRRGGRNERYEDEEEGEEEEEEEDEDGWRERKLKVMPKVPTASPNPVPTTGSSEDEEDDDEEEVGARNGGRAGGDRKIRIPKMDSSSEESSDEDLDSPTVVRSSQARSNFSAFPDLGSLIVTRGEWKSSRIGGKYREREKFQTASPRDSRG